jgi:hypothetical protein
LEQKIMAIGWIYLKYLNSKGVFSKRDTKILDIGCQNLFSIPEDEGLSFALEHRDVDSEEQLSAAIRQLSARSTWPKGIGDPVYFFEFAALCGLDYLAYDIFAGQKIRIFDLNLDAVPEHHCGRFDCVFNFGTTEHVFNQYNAFKVIHDLTRVGGHMFHQVPTTGYINHGYWVYSPRIFLELSRANNYEVKAFWITGPQGTSQIANEARAPELVWDDALPENGQLWWQQNPIPNGLINALLQKTTDEKFRLVLDTTTSNRAPDSALAASYSASRSRYSPAVIFRKARRFMPRVTLSTIGQ